jgi:hypothetical protein
VNPSRLAFDIRLDFLLRKSSTMTICRTLSFAAILMIVLCAITPTTSVLPTHFMLNIRFLKRRSEAIFYARIITVRCRPQAAVPMLLNRHERNSSSSEDALMALDNLDPIAQSHRPG